jgi:outer membrane lipase/esterase
MNLQVPGTRRAALALLLGLAALISACGGGDPVVAFEPRRVLAFGDENSLITAEGRKYTVNALTTETNDVKTINCAGNTLWVQRLASNFGLTFPDCNPDAVPDPRSRIYAAAGAIVADLPGQIDLHLATDTFSEKDLVTLFVGQNDVLEQYSQYPGVSKEQLLSGAYAAGLALAGQVSRVADAGGKVIVSTVPDLSVSPFALKENETSGDSTRSALLRDLVAKFNEGLRVGISKLSGSQVAIMLTDELVQAMSRFPTSYGGMTNVTDPVCDEALAATVELCTTDTLVSGGDAARYLWADDTHLGPTGHQYIGSLAATRARSNPF